MIWHHDEPTLSFSSLNHYSMMRKIKTETNLTVILSGEGGDEGFAGYAKFCPLHLYNVDKGHKAQFQRIVERVNKGKGIELISYEELMNVTKPSFAAIESLKTGAWVEVL